MTLHRRTLLTLPLALATPAIAQSSPAKVGVIGSFSGPFSIFGRNFRIGIEAWMAGKDGMLAGRRVEFIYRDLPTANPAQARSIAQELIVRDKVDFLAGVVFTPDGMAIAPLSEQAKVPFVIFNATGSAITPRSPYAIRTSFTLPQVVAPLGTYVAGQGIKKMATAVTDYAPGQDAETGFKKTFEAAGGTVSESIRMPLTTSDFGPILQRVANAGVDAVFAFLPGGTPAVSFVRAYIENGLKERGVRFFTTGDLTMEPDLPSFGDAGIGLLSAGFYAVSHDSAENKAFLDKVRGTAGSTDDLTYPAVAAYDGTMLIERMMQTGTDPGRAIAAVQDLAWISPRGPVRIDPKLRHIRQTIYIRQVARDAAGRYENHEIASFPDQGDPGA